MKKIFHLLLLSIFLASCGNAVSATSNVTVTSKVTVTFTPAPTEISATLANTPEATATEDPNKPADATGQDKDGNYIKKVTENGKEITETWYAIQLAGDAEKGVTGHYFRSNMELDAQGNLININIILPGENIYSFWTGNDFSGVPLSISSDTLLIDFNSMIITHENANASTEAGKGVTFSSHFFDHLSPRFFENHPELKSVDKPYKNVGDVPYDDSEKLLNLIAQGQAFIDVMVRTDPAVPVSKKNPTTFKVEQWNIADGVEVHLIDWNSAAGFRESNDVRSYRTIVNGKMVIFSAVKDPANVDDDTLRMAIVGSIFDELDDPNGAGEKEFKSSVTVSSADAGPDQIINGNKRGTSFIKINK